MRMNSGPSEHLLSGAEFWVAGHDRSGYKAMGMGRILSRGELAGLSPVSLRPQRAGHMTVYS